MKTTSVTTRLEVLSPAFESYDLIPQKYSCDGEEINPPLQIEGLAPEVISLAIIVEDPDAMKGTFDHWVIWNIQPQDHIPENFSNGIQGKNGAGKTGYTGPCPPTGIHHYHFKVYALDKMLDLQEGSSKKELEHAMRKHIVAQGELIGLYTRPERNGNHNDQ
jgi:Raf kinase inhibitor-like YbhB/YbcL family protein